MTITGTSFSGYKADLGAAICNRGEMSIEHCLFAGNEATRGGAIFNDGNLRVVNSRFEKNKATNAGGAAILNFPSTQLRLVDSHLEGNTAAVGGAIQCWTGADLSIKGTQFKNNKASWGGGAISDYSFKFDQLFGTKYTSNGNKYDGNTPFDYWGFDIDLTCVVGFLLVACCFYLRPRGSFAMELMQAVQAPMGDDAGSEDGDGDSDDDDNEVLQEGPTTDDAPVMACDLESLVESAATAARPLDLSDSESSDDSTNEHERRWAAPADGKGGRARPPAVGDLPEEADGERRLEEAADQQGWAERVLATTLPDGIWTRTGPDGPRNIPISTPARRNGGSTAREGAVSGESDTPPE